MTDPETALEPVPEIDAVKAQLAAVEQKAAENWDKCLRASS